MTSWLEDGSCAAVRPGRAETVRREAALVEPVGTDLPVDNSPRKDGELPPLLKSILQEYSATGLPPAYLSKTPPSQNGEDAS